MNIFNRNNIEESGFISKENIFKYVSEEDIYEIVFGFKPKEFDYVTSPFREDSTPGCWFQYSYSGKLSFVDFSSKIYAKGQRMIRIDCFDAVKEFFNLPNLYQTLVFIKKHLIDGKNLPEREVKSSKKPLVAKETEILISARGFTLEDKEFWQDRYGISKENLMEDRVFPVQQFKIINSAKGDFSLTVREPTYCFTDFKENRKKIYRPFQKRKNRFLSNCKKSDIGGIRFLPEKGQNLIITKSYKDYRVLKNQGLTVVWFQNEGMYPDLGILLTLCKRFDFITIFFDNDLTGKEASKNLEDIINSYLPGRATRIFLPEESKCKDPSDFIHLKGRNSLLNFLIQKKLL